MNRFQCIWRLGLVFLVGLAVLAVTSRTLPASFRPAPTYTHVEIDGINYGRFDSISGLNDFDTDGSPSGLNQRYTKITLTRDFVTDRSLYLWAKNEMSKKFRLRDIHLITAREDGTVLSRQVLGLCQPLSWSVETTNPSLGGFNETIDVAVQKITLL